MSKHERVQIGSGLETLPPVKIVHGEVEAGDAEPLLQQEQDLVLHPLTELTQAQHSILHRSDLVMKAALGQQSIKF